MSELNYLRIAQILGGRITEISRPTFGGFSAPSLSVERFRLIHVPEHRDPVDPSIIRKIVAAFDKVHDGYEVDRLLVDPVLSKAFIDECRRTGLDLPIAFINRRLQGARKTKNAQYRPKKGTRSAGLDPQPYFFAAELGFTQLSYRRDVSVDDVVTDPKIGQEFVSLCHAITPHGTGMDFKWAALRLRKMRTFTRPKVQKLLALQPEEIERKMETVGNLAEITTADLPEVGGLYSFSERKQMASNYLYIGSADSLRKGIEPFQDAKPFLAIGQGLWHPALRDITLQIGVIPKRWMGAARRDLGFRLIEDKHPLFNMPVHLEAA